MEELERHEVAIQCRGCQKLWRLQIPLTGNKVEVIASICECSAIIVGNYNAKLIEEEKKGRKTLNPENTVISMDDKYLSNGHFDFLEMSPDELKKLPVLALE